MSVDNILSNRLIAHRGLWSSASSGNSQSALLSARESGFGLETDIRDHLSALVINHDPPTLTDPALSATSILTRLAEVKSGAPVALNVKSDGLVPLLQRECEALASLNYYCFDMSWPQLLLFVRSGIPVALRVSEWESLDYSLFARLGIPIRVWLDAFESEWWLGSPEIDELCKRGQVSVVSPEIHGRPPEAVWDWFFGQVELGADVYLCTDRCHEVLARCL